MTKGYHDSKTPESIRDLWQTPKPVFEYYNRRFGFRWDIASSNYNTLCRNYITEEENAFTCDEEAFDGSVWCNPPYSDILPWVELCLSISKWSNVPVAMLLPADTSVKWFKLAFENCTECHFISGRLSFVNVETQKPVNGNNKGSVVFIFDPNSPIKQAVSLIDRDEIMKTA